MLRSDLHKGSPATENQLWDKAQAVLKEFLTKNRMRSTSERLAILERVFARTDHFDAEELHRDIEAGGYHVSLSTLYATMQLLADARLVRVHYFGSQPVQYERALPGMPENHHHLVCNVCGRVKVVRSPQLVEQLVKGPYPTFKADSVALYVYGTCSRCLKRLRRLRGKS